MTNTYSTQPDSFAHPCSTAHPCSAHSLFPKTPKQPLFLSMEEVKAILDIDLNGVDKADKDALILMESLANCLATEVINFNSVYPATSIAGLVLRVEVVLGVVEME